MIKFFDFDLLMLFLLNSGFLISLFIINHFRNKIYFKSNPEDLKKSYPLFLKFIDRYYITNLPYTIFASLFYIFSTILLFLVIRYILLGQIVIITRIDLSNNMVNYSEVFKGIFKYCLFILCIYQYKTVITIIFYIEILKLRVYVEKYTIRYTIRYFCFNPFGQNLCTIIWILSYRIYKQTFRADIFDADFDVFKHELLDYDETDYKELYKNHYFLKMMENLMGISKKSKMVAHLFFLNAKFFKFLSRHLSRYRNLGPGLFKFIPHMLLILSLLYDLYNREINLVYYTSFLYFLFYAIKNYCKFEQQLDDHTISNLYKYFYQNNVLYTIQRSYILASEEFILNKQSRQNDNLLCSYKASTEDLEEDIIYAIFNHLKKSQYLNNYGYYYNFSYLRATILLAFIIINVFIYIKVNLTITIFNFVINKLLIFILCIFIIFIASKIFNRVKIFDEFTKDEGAEGHEYKKKYSIIFWILVMLQSYLIWIILLQPEIFFMNTNILLELPYILKIEKIYTVEEKIMYLFQFFEHYLSLQSKIRVEPEYLRYILRQIDFKYLITEEIKLKDIQVYIKLYLETNYNFEYFLYAFKEKLILTLNANIFNNPWYIFAKNTIMIGALLTVILTYNNLRIIYNMLNTVEGQQAIVKSIIISYKKSEFSQELIFVYFVKMIKKIRDYF